MTAELLDERELLPNHREVRFLDMSFDVACNFCFDTQTGKTSEGRSAIFRVQEFEFLTSLAARFLVTFLFKCIRRLGHQPFVSGCRCDSFLVLLLSSPSFLHCWMRCSLGEVFPLTNTRIQKEPQEVEWDAHFNCSTDFAVKTACALRTRRAAGSCSSLVSFSYFATKIYHQDVNSNDALCLDIFKDLERCTDDPQNVALNFLTTDRPEPVSSSCAKDCASSFDGAVSGTRWFLDQLDDEASRLWTIHFVVEVIRRSSSCRCFGVQCHAFAVSLFTGVLFVLFSTNVALTCTRSEWCWTRPTQRCWRWWTLEKLDFISPPCLWSSCCGSWPKGFADGVTSLSCHNILMASPVY